MLRVPVVGTVVVALIAWPTASAWTQDKPDAPAPSQPAAAPAPAQPKAPAAEAPGPRLFMEDGQLASHGIQVFVTPDIPEGASPQLRLRRHHAVTKASEEEGAPWIPLVPVARGQVRTVTEAGQKVPRTGTLLFFDVPKGFIPLYKPAVRAQPELTWTEKAADGKPDLVRVVVGPDDVYIGNVVGAWLWTLGSIAVVTSVVVLLARRAKDSLVGYLLDPEGRMSLARVQAALWTLAVGSVVLGYGLTRLEVPRIPETLVALMGLSLLTSGLSRMRADEPAAAAPAADRRNEWRFSDLVTAPPGQPDAGIATLERAQMLFWTLLLVGLFLAKSIVEGAMWDVPWELVALTGFSQAAYLASKKKKDDGAAGGEPDPKLTEIATKLAKVPANLGAVTTKVNELDTRLADTAARLAAVEKKVG